MIFDIEIDFENYTTRITIWFSKEHREREIDDLSSITTSIPGFEKLSMIAVLSMDFSI